MALNSLLPPRSQHGAVPMGWHGGAETPCFWQSHEARLAPSDNCWEWGLGKILMGPQASRVKAPMAARERSALQSRAVAAARHHPKPCATTGPFVSPVPSRYLLFSSIFSFIPH